MCTRSIWLRCGVACVAADIAEVHVDVGALPRVAGGLFPGRAAVVVFLCLGRRLVRCGCRCRHRYRSGDVPGQGMLRGVQFSGLSISGFPRVEPRTTVQAGRRLSAAGRCAFRGFGVFGRRSVRPYGAALDSLQVADRWIPVRDRLRREAVRRVPFWSAGVRALGGWGRGPLGACASVAQPDGILPSLIARVGSVADGRASDHGRRSHGRESRQGEGGGRQLTACRAFGAGGAAPT